MFDLKKSPTFEIYYFITCQGVVLLCFGSVFTDTLLLTFGLVIAEYLKQTQEQFVIAIEEDSDEKIHQAIESFMKIKRSFEHFCNFFNAQLFIRYFDVAALICVLGFELLEVLCFRVFFFEIINDFL